MTRINAKTLINTPFKPWGRHPEVYNIEIIYRETIIFGRPPPGPGEGHEYDSFCINLTFYLLLDDKEKMY